MHYYLVLGCEHSLSVYRKVFSPKVGDRFVCRHCPPQTFQKVVSVRITEPKQLSDKTTLIE